MDWTLIRTKTGKVFPKDEFDWLPLYDDLTLSKLRQVHEQGYLIVIFTNQAGVIRGYSGSTAYTISEKFKAIGAMAGVPMIFMASTYEHLEYRKPDTGLWQLLLKEILEIEGCKIDKESSFYCGDAAGRKQKPFNDHSNDDHFFSVNLQVKFYTPEMYFLGEKLNFNPIQGKTILDQKYLR